MMSSPIMTGTKNQYPIYRRAYILGPCWLFGNGGQNGSNAPAARPLLLWTRSSLARLRRIPGAGTAKKNRSPTDHTYAKDSTILALTRKPCFVGSHGSVVFWAATEEATKFCHCRLPPFACFFPTPKWLNASPAKQH